MTSSGDNPLLSHLPPGITEEDVIDLVDGVVPPTREKFLIDTLRAQPRLGLLIKQLRADSAAVSELPASLPAPTNLLDGIEAKLNRAAMASLVDESARIDAPIPIYTPPVVIGRSPLAAFAESRAVRALATAASLAIVGGIGYFAVREIYRQWPSVPPPTPVVINPDTPNATNPDGASGTAIALTTPPNTDTTPIEPIAMAAFVGPLPESTSDIPAELTLAQALELAHEGRLVITLRSSAVPSTLRLLEQLAAAREDDTRWRSFSPEALPVELAALSTPLPDSTLNPAPGHPAPQVPTFAGDSSPRPTPLKPLPDLATSPAPRHVVNKAVRLVWMPSDEKALEALLKNLNLNQREQTGTLRVLPSAIDARPTLDPESVLWWNRSSEAWTVRVAVPIVVEVVD